MPKQPSKADLFLELATPDSDGFSRPVGITEFTGRYVSLVMGNGGGWCRDDGALAKTYIIKRNKQGGRIVSVELVGLKKMPISKPIPAAIRKQIKSQPCVVLGISSVECDHKDGRRDDPRLSDITRVRLDDFQPLSKAVNAAKRNHCARCRATDRRFDATALGYKVSQFKGNGVYRGTCVGCYWHDPKRFNAEVSGKG